MKKKRRKVVLIAGMVVLAGGIFILSGTLTIGEGHILRAREMNQMWGGQVCGDFPCRKAGGYCSIPCTPVGSYCESCALPGMHYICSAEGPPSSHCIPGVDKEGCGNRFWGECRFPRTCYPDEYIHEVYCDRQNASGTSCPTG